MSPERASARLVCGLRNLRATKLPQEFQKNGRKIIQHHAVSTMSLNACPTCRSANIVRHPDNECHQRKVQHVPAGTAYQKIVIRLPIYVCLDCRDAGREPYCSAPHPEVAQVGLHTVELANLVSLQLTRHNPVAIAEQTGLSDGTVRNMKEAVAVRLDDLSVNRLLPDLLSIDGVHLNGTERMHLFDWGARRTEELLPSMTRQDLKDFLSLRDLSVRPTAVSIDFDPTLRKMVRSLIKPERIVSDKNHLMARAKEHMIDGVRDLGLREDWFSKLDFFDHCKGKGRIALFNRLLTEPRKNLPEDHLAALEALRAIPEADSVYRAFRGLFGLYNCADSRAGRRYLTRWRGAMWPAAQQVFQPTWDLIRQWRKEILAALDLRNELEARHRASGSPVRYELLPPTDAPALEAEKDPYFLMTQGPIESAHRRFHDLESNSFGLLFEGLRQRVMLVEGWWRDHIMDEVVPGFLRVSRKKKKGRRRSAEG